MGGSGVGELGQAGLQQPGMDEGEQTTQVVVSLSGGDPAGGLAK
jgi:hypothetical protein